ncbi:MAG: PD-(D/E)XK nuclease family transposase, partial [Anaerovoracaceae bacterium]
MGSKTRSAKQLLCAFFCQIKHIVLQNTVNRVKCKVCISYNSQPGDKQVIMDIKAITGKRVQIDVEMQNGNLLYYANRSIYYSGVMITNSLAKGESYDKMKRSIVITIVNGK